MLPQKLGLTEHGNRRVTKKKNPGMKPIPGYDLRPSRKEKKTLTKHGVK
jgi:hypothetical protein